ncbi:NAD(P)/FAD-dependent oxidoreductase [Streptomyces sp. NRRL F-5123]|uniref:NAD(P)/FAD-dependent oxidoreductase n=1 Tax=Streptomyces sp. NRRL F-5123 TaxID=1463856 RepID=UPI0004E1C152|nr:tryptophan 7-halogenase [Streptomyces sp. NRRL F-5123]
MATKAPPPQASGADLSKAQHCDVFVLGSGLAGSTIATVLAAQGAKVVLVDAAQHPRMAIGESQTPQLAEWLHILAERYGVPELASLAKVGVTNKVVGPTHGVKVHFGFVRHEVGKEPNPAESTQFAIPRLLAQNSHMFRQDTDSWMFQVAVKYGVQVRQLWRAADMDFDDDGVTVSGTNGDVYRARYLVDASGFRSLLAEKFDLREKPARFKHHSRSLFNHFIGIKPFDDVVDFPAEHRPPIKWHKGTMHHMIDRGWLWIIPFNNYRKSKNPLVSVGLQLDERVYPKPKDMTPQQEFDAFLDKYPAIKRQFVGARPVREWVSTDRLQYSSRKSVGPRWCLMSHAAGFIDPLFSRGLSNTMEVVDALASRVLEALKDNDFSEERFSYVEQLEAGLLDFNDELVNSAVISFSHFRLWNAVFRVWGCFITPGVMRLTGARLRYVVDNDDSHFTALEKTENPGLWWPESKTFQRILEVTAETCEKFEVGELTGDQAADIILKVVQDSPEVNPTFGWKDPATRFVAPSTWDLAKFVRWGLMSAGPDMRKLTRFVVSGGLKAGPRARKLM